MSEEAPDKTNPLYLDLLTSARYPIYCRPLQKAGCTTIKNLFYRLDYGRWYSDPMGIHSHERDLLKFTDYDVSAQEVATSGKGFAIVRQPLDRLLSFYFDKLATVNEQAADMPWLVRYLVENYRFTMGSDLDVEQHRVNLMRTLDFIEDNMKGRTLMGRNPHWLPQSYILDIHAVAELRTIPIEHMARGIEDLVGDLVPGIGEIIAEAPRFNETKWKNHIDKAELINRPLRKRVRTVFMRDFRIHRRALRAFEGA